MTPKQYEHGNTGYMTAQLGFADQGVEKPLFTLPVGARVISINATIQEAFNGDAANTLNIGDATDDDAYLSGVACGTPAGFNSTQQKTVSETSRVIVGKVLGGGTTAATAGAAEVTVGYLLPTTKKVNY